MPACLVVYSTVIEADGNEFIRVHISFEFTTIWIPSFPLLTTMTVNVASVGVKTFAVCAAVLYTKFFIITRIQAVKKYDAGTRPPEDTFLPPREHIPQGYGLVETKDKAVLKAREEEQRWNHIVMNDIEALPLGMFVFAGALAVGVKESVTIPSMIVFTASRCIYSVAYAKALQPHRFIFYGFAVLSVFVTSGNIVSTVFF